MVFHKNVITYFEYFQQNNILNANFQNCLFKAKYSPIEDKIEFQHTV